MPTEPEYKLDGLEVSLEEAGLPSLLYNPCAQFPSSPTQSERLKSGFGGGWEGHLGASGGAKCRKRPRMGDEFTYPSPKNVLLLFCRTQIVKVNNRA